MTVESDLEFIGRLPTDIKEANALIDEAAEEPTIDELLRRDPFTLTDGERRHIVEREREKRAAYIKSEAEKKGKA